MVRAGGVLDWLVRWPGPDDEQERRKVRAGGGTRGVFRAGKGRRKAGEFDLLRIVLEGNPVESTQNSELRQSLEAKSRDDLNIIAKRLRVSGYRRLKKPDLVASILREDRTLLLRHLSISWWDRYHNHVYGGITVLGLVLTVVQMMPLERTSSKNLPAVLPTEPMGNGASGSLLRPTITPEGYLPITMEQMLDEVANEKLTALQLDSLKKGYVGKTIQWIGTVRDVSPLWAHDPKSEIVLIVSPVVPSSKFPPVITVLFSPNQRAMLEKLKSGDKAEFQAVVNSFDDFDHLPRLNDGKLLRFSAGD